jgi:hypothetical protein
MSFERDRNACTLPATQYGLRIFRKLSIWFNPLIKISFVGLTYRKSQIRSGSLFTVTLRNDPDTSIRLVYTRDSNLECSCEATDNPQVESSIYSLKQKPDLASLERHKTRPLPTGDNR